MRSKQALVQALTQVAGFSAPDLSLEQYPTSPDLAATLLHRAALTDDITGRTVVDLGTGTGMLAIGAALTNPSRVIGIDIDLDALGVATQNTTKIDTDLPIEWVCGDATNPPLQVTDATVVMNPPFGAQYTARHADRDFLAAAHSIGRVSYSIHNQGSEEFISAFAADHGGTVTHAFAAEFTLDRAFDHHTHASKELAVEVYRIDWTTTAPPDP